MFISRTALYAEKKIIGQMFVIVFLKNEVKKGLSDLYDIYTCVEIKFLKCVFEIIFRKFLFVAELQPCLWLGDPKFDPFKIAKMEPKLLLELFLY